MSKRSSAYEKMIKKLNWIMPVGAEEKLFCVVCKAPRTEDPPVDGDASYVEKRVLNSLNHWGYAPIDLRDFDKLGMMYGVNWNEMHKDIFRHKKKSAYALLYRDDLLSAAENAMKNLFFLKRENAMKNHLAKNISDLHVNYQSCRSDADAEILTIKGVLKPNGRHLHCDFVDVNHASTVLSSSATSHRTRGHARVGPSTT